MKVVSRGVWKPRESCTSRGRQSSHVVAILVHVADAREGGVYRGSRSWMTVMVVSGSYARQAVIAI